MAATKLPLNSVEFLSGWHKNMLMFFIQNYKETDAEMMVTVYIYGLRPELRDELHAELVKNPYSQSIPVEWRNIVARAYKGTQQAAEEGGSDISFEAQRSQKLVEEAIKALADEQGRVAELTKQLADAKTEVAGLKRELIDAEYRFKEAAKRDVNPPEPQAVGTYQVTNTSGYIDGQTIGDSGSVAMPSNEPDAPITTAAATTPGAATEPDELTRLLQGDGGKS